MNQTKFTEQPKTNSSDCVHFTKQHLQTKRKKIRFPRAKLKTNQKDIQATTMATLAKIEIDSIMRDIQHSDRSKRQTALQRLFETVHAETDDTVLKAILNVIYLHLLKCYADKFESCRALTISVVSEFLQQLHNHEPFFYEFIVPIIRKRIGLAELHECSEEIQLQLLQQVEAIVATSTTSSRDSIERAYNDIIDIVVRNLSNCFAPAQKQCCAIVKALAIACNRFGGRAECLVDPLIGMLKHRQSSSRITAIETLG